MAPTSMKTYMEFFREDRPSTTSSRQHHRIAADHTHAGPVTDYGATVTHWMRHRQPKYKGSYRGEFERPSPSYLVDVSCPSPVFQPLLTRLFRCSHQQPDPPMRQTPYQVDGSISLSTRLSTP